jgi:hypothetical protein
MADVLTVVAKIRAAKGKGDALAALLKEQVAAVMTEGRASPKVRDTGRNCSAPRRPRRDPAQPNPSQEASQWSMPCGF